MSASPTLPFVHQEHRKIARKAIHYFKESAAEADKRAVQIIEAQEKKQPGFAKDYYQLLENHAYNISILQSYTSRKDYTSDASHTARQAKAETEAEATQIYNKIAGPEFKYSGIVDRVFFSVQAVAAQANDAYRWN